jgi:CMP-N-acetylneuraminic acid synthetase
MSNSTICIIPARANSSRCPGKNVKPFAGKSLTIMAAEQAWRLRDLFTDIIFTSNDEIAIEQARSVGPEIKIRRRPDHLCGPDASSESAIDDAIAWAGSSPDAILLLEVTSPLRLDEDIVNCIKLSEETGQGVKSVRRVKNCLDGEVVSERLQLDGSIHLWKANWVRDVPYTRFSLYEIPEERSVHIDYPYEFEIAELLYRRQNG